MGQIIESRFRVLGFDQDDVLLNDIAGRYLPVYVNKEKDSYTEEIQSKVENMESGNVIEAEIQSESTTRQDGTWKFIEIRFDTRTRFHFIENADTHSSHIEKANQLAKKTDNETIRVPLSSGDEQIGFITVSEDQGDQFWRRLQDGINTHEVDLQNLEQIDDPPYEIIYTRSSAKDQLVFYHFATKDTDVAASIIESNK